MLGDITTGLVLFAHGARDPRWREPLERLLALVTQRHPGPATCAFLEFMTPDLPTACSELARAGANRIVVVPLFLGTGGHLREDLPALLDAARERSGVPVHSAPAAGEQPRVLEALADYCLASLSETAAE
jgi:sirohydrochlorin cobaltochelatase